MGQWHLHALRRLSIGVSGIVDPDSGRASRLARLADGCRPYASVREAFDDGSHRVAHVCAPLGTHVGLVTELLDRGAHVLVEKPIAATADETQRLTSLAQRLDRLICPVHQFLFQRGFLNCVADLERMGSVLHIDTVAASSGAAGQGPGRAKEVVADILPHPLSLMRRILARGLESAEWHPVSASPGEFRVAGACGPVSLGILVSMGGRPTRNTVRIICEGGTLHADLFHGYAVREPPEVSRRRKASRPFTFALASLAAAGSNLARRASRREPAYPGLRELIRLFHGAIQGGPPPIAIDEMLDVAVARDALMALR
jgi:predicted dehydrogenase